MTNNFYSFEDTYNKSLVVKDNLQFILSSSDLSSYAYIDLIDNDVVVHGLHLYYETIKQKDNSFQRLIKFFKDLDENKLILSSIDSYQLENKTYNELYSPVGFDSLSGADLFYWYKEYREIYSYVKNYLSGGKYLKEFSESIGNIAYFNEYNDNIISLRDTSFPSISASVKDYPIILDNKLSNDILEFINESTTEASLVQRNNVKNLVGLKESTEAHGENLVADTKYSDRIDLVKFKEEIKKQYDEAYRLLNLFNEKTTISSFEDFIYGLDSVLVDRIQTRVKNLLK
jgi:hypothetical protein